MPSRKQIGAFQQSAGIRPYKHKKQPVVAGDPVPQAVFCVYYSVGGMGGITAKNAFNSSTVPALAHSVIPFFQTKLSAVI